MCLALERAMRQEGYQTEVVCRGRDGLDKIRLEHPALVILDLHLPDIDGLEVLKGAKTMDPKLPVIILTANGTIETAIEAMKSGAADYITQPFDWEELKRTIKQNLLLIKSETEVTCLRSEPSSKYGNIITRNKVMKDISALIQQVAHSNASVLITGESGTGKELAAVSIHQNSPRRNRPFITVNCAALPEQLLENELFGHERGAFTGATARKPGRFELANKGTVFLDEIAEMSLNMQAKLLRVLQEKSFERVGGTETLSVDVRVIAATNRELDEAIKKGVFREDLFYRLNVIPIHLPPLRERREDIPLLAKHFLQKYGYVYQVSEISAAAMELLCNYHWPGNVRELQNVIERSTIICGDSRIEPQHLPGEINASPRYGVSNFLIDFPDKGISFEELEKELIIKALDKSGGNQTKAAKLLGITRSAFLYRSQKHDISWN